MIRIVAFLLALLLAPLTARGNTFDTYVIDTYAPTDYWSFSANTTDQGSAGINGTATGTITYGQSVTSYVGGFVPGTSTSYITVGQSFSTSSALRLGAFFKAASNGDTTTQYLVNQTGSISNSINLHFSDSGCSGEFDVVVIIGGSYTVTCLARQVNDGTGHFAFVQCGGGAGTGWVDGVEVASFTCAFDTPQAASYTIGNATSTYPVLGAMGAVMYWVGGSLFTPWQVYTIAQCGLIGACQPPTPPPPPCVSRPGQTLQWCDTMSYAGCDQGTFAWRNGAIGPLTTATGTSFAGYIQPTVGSGTIAGTTLTIDTMTSGAFAAGDTITGTDVTGGTQIITQLTGGGTGQAGTYSLSASSTVSMDETISSTNYKLNTLTSLPLGSTLYDNNTCEVSGNNTVLNQSQIQSGVKATDWYVTTPAQTIASPGILMWPGQWQAGSVYLQNNVAVSTNSLVVGQGGGGGLSGGFTARYIPTALAPNSEVTLVFFGYFSATTNPPTFAFNWTGNFGFCSSDVGSGCGSVAIVEFSNQNTPPSGYVNLNVALNNIGSIGNFNISGNAWHIVVLDVKRSTGSDGLVQIYVDDVLQENYSGQTDYGSLGANDQVFFAGQFVDSEVDAEAYFGPIGVYTGHYTPPYYPPGGGSGPMTLWIP